ncbi:uncharacterized protein LOC122289295 [Carya illinoinensis]|uniref:uncharacterized protein LOC122289295 n=1 Tax=Carya illinoinensis TaxID=32201 RepID=UPI001C72216A|nr:uncharacterized protein LOC122289295 [Carya illinoinensis]
MEGLEGMWENLRLTEKESSLIKLGGMEERMREKGGNSLVGKIWIDRQIGREFVESTMGKIWRVSKPARFQEIGSNMFIITFFTHADMDRVMDGRPWLFDNHLFALKLFDGLAQAQSIVFDTEVFWIRMLNLPLGSMNEECGRMIGSTVGKVVEVDVPEDGIGWGSSLRVRIEIPIQQAITRGRMVAVEGKKVWVSLKYEKLPRLCFECGLMVHDGSGCCKIGGGRGEGPHFGAWLRAEKTTRSAF